MCLQIRLSEARAKPIDILVKNIALGDRFGVDLSAPYRVFDGLNAEEAEELLKEVKELRELDREDKLHCEYWESLETGECWEACPFCLWSGGGGEGDLASYSDRRGSREEVLPKRHKLHAIDHSLFDFVTLSPL